MDTGGDLADRSQPPHVAILPSSGAGHFMPLAELARRLALHHGFSVTFIATAADAASPFYAPFRASLPPGVTAVALPPVDVSAARDPVTAISLTVVASLPAIHRVLCSQRPVAFVADIFCSDAFDVASELRIPSFVFFPSNLFLLFLSLRGLLRFQEKLPDPVELPGCLPVYAEDLPSVLEDRSSEEFTWLIHHVKRHDKAQRILVNTFREMDLEAAAQLSLEEDAQSEWPPVSLVGPLVQTWRTSSDDSLCSEWLDKQRDESVLLVSLGSAGVLSCDQTREMALGLEMSGHRFLWVVRDPVDKLAATGDDDPLGYLPEGFLERTEEQGLVVPSWAPQEQILSHRGVGGFLTHCGWNSTIESVVHGVPMVAWPLYAEQRMNALLLVKRLKVALRAEAAEDGLVRKEAISAVVAELMAGTEGRAVRERVRLLREAATAAMALGGAASSALDRLVKEWTGSM